MRLPPIKEWLPPALFCVAGLVISHHETVLHGFGFTQSDLGDTRFINHLLEHVWRWLTFDPNHKDIWSLPHFWPQADTLVWSDTLIGAAPFYVPWRLFMEPDSAFQAFGLTCGALNFIAAYFFARRCFRFSSLTSSVVGALFAFSAIRINLTMHWQFFPQAYTVWALHALYRLVEGGLGEKLQRRWLAVFFACFSLQWWACIYLGWFLLFVATVALAVLVSQPKPRAQMWQLLRSQPYTIFLFAALCVVSMVPMAWRYLEVEKMFGGRPYNEVLSMLPTPNVWLHHPAQHWLYGFTAQWPFFSGISMEHEQRNGFGFAVTAAAFVGLYLMWSDKRFRFVGVLTLLLIALTTQFGADLQHGRGGASAWQLIWGYFPAAKAIRAVSRLGVLYMLGVAVLAGAALEQLIARFKQPGLYGAFALGAFFLLEQGQTTPAFDKAANRRDVKMIADAVGKDCDAFLFSPVAAVGPYWKYQLDAVWAATMSGVPTLNGYSGQSPPGWGLGETRLNSQFDEQRVAQAANEWLQQKKVADKKVCWVKLQLPEGPRQAEPVAQQVPSTMTAGATVPVEVTMKNSGTGPWLPEQRYRLGSFAPQDNVTWGKNRIELPKAVAPGESVVLRFDAVAPSQPGKYTFQWRMVQDGVAWFGPPTAPVEVDVQAGASSAP